jgi:hypothetical protein
MRSALSKRNEKSRKGLRSIERGVSPRLAFKSLSTLLDEYSAADYEGSAEKLSQLAKEIRALILSNRKKVSQSCHYSRHIE